MKRCPTCQKTFDDAMRFCQADGTPLVEDAEPADPYKTMVASKDDIAAALSSPTGSAPAREEEPLQIPAEPEPIESAGTAIGDQARADEGQVIEIPPLEEETPPEPPAFTEPSLSPPSFGDASPPPSPFSGGGTIAAEVEEQPTLQQTTPPIPSPFGQQKPAAFEPQQQSPPFAEPEPARPAFNPFEPQAATTEQAVVQAEWTPPPVPQQSWQPEVGQGGFNPPPPASAGGENKTLPIISLVAGILSLCCYVSPVTGIVALITGFLGIKNANNNPAQYGGKTLAIVGMILGGLFFLIGIVYWIFIIFFNGLALLMQMAGQ